MKMSEEKYPLINDTIYVVGPITIQVADKGATCDFCKKDCGQEMAVHLPVALSVGSEATITFHIACAREVCKRTLEAIEEHRLRLMVQ